MYALSFLPAAVVCKCRERSLIHSLSSADPHMHIIELQVDGIMTLAEFARVHRK